MAKNTTRNGRFALLGGKRNLGLIAAGVGASLLLSALLTLSLLPDPGVPSGVRTAQVGDISDRDYKAPTAITILDEEATEQLHREAVENAPVVYDFDEGRLATLTERLGIAFGAAREAAQVEGGSETPGASPSDTFRGALGEEVSVSDTALAYLISPRM